MKKIFFIITTLMSLTCFAPSPKQSGHQRSQSSAPNSPDVPPNTPVEASPIPQSRSSVSLSSQTSFNSGNTEELTQSLEKIQDRNTIAPARIGELQTKAEKEGSSYGQNSFVTISLGSTNTPTETSATSDYIREYIQAQKEEQTVRLQHNQTPSSEESTTTESLSPEKQEELIKTLAVHGRILQKETGQSGNTPSSSRNLSPISITEEMRNLSQDS